MTDTNDRVFEFDNIRVEPVKFKVWRGLEELVLEPKTLSVLIFLLKNRGRLIEKDELLNAIWQDTFVTENAMAREIAKLRKALGDDAKEAKYIQTVHTKGYRFVAEVSESGTDGHGVVATPVMSSEPNGKVDSRQWWLAAIGLAVLVIVGGFFGYRYLASSSKQIESIAVMPFVNESGNSDLEYLSDGMTETLITSLSQVPNLAVIARSSVIRYKGKEFDPKKIASELNVQAILTGRVVQRGDQLALNLELIDAQTESILWANKYERKVADLVPLQSEIAKNLSQILRSKLSDENLHTVTKSYTQNTDAYQAYLTGKFFHQQTKGDSTLKANEYYQKAVDLDPNFALAWVALSRTYSGTEITKIMSAGEARQKQSFALRKALELDPNLSEAHALNGRNIFNQWDFDGAEKELKLAIELDPNSSQGHLWYSWLLAAFGEFEAAVTEGKKAQQLDPLDPLINTFLGAWLINAKRYDEALAQLNHTLEINPDYDQAHDWMAVLFTYTGKYEEGIAEMDKYLELAKGRSELRGNILYVTHLQTVGYIKSLTGDKTRAEKALAELSQRYEEKGDVQETHLAVLSIAIGDKDQAFEWLEKGLQRRAGYIKFLKTYPFLDSLHDDPRFTGLLKRIGLPE